MFGFNICNGKCGFCLGYCPCKGRRRRESNDHETICACQAIQEKNETRCREVLAEWVADWQLEGKMHVKEPEAEQVLFWLPYRCMMPSVIAVESQKTKHDQDTRTDDSVTVVLLSVYLPNLGSNGYTNSHCDVTCRAISIVSSSL